MRKLRDIVNDRFDRPGRFLRGLICGRFWRFRLGCRLGSVCAAGITPGICRWLIWDILQRLLIGAIGGLILFNLLLGLGRRTWCRLRSLFLLTVSGRHQCGDNSQSEQNSHHNRAFGACPIRKDFSIAGKLSNRKIWRRSILGRVEQQNGSPNGQDQPLPIEDRSRRTTAHRGLQLAIARSLAGSAAGALSSLS